MSVSVAVARRNVDLVEASLADIRDRIAPFRRALYGVKEVIRSQCLIVDSARQELVEWRAPSKSEIAWLDEAWADFREKTEHLLPEEERIKAALREAQWALRDAEYEEKKAIRDADRKAKSGRKDVGNGQLSFL